MQFRDNDYYRAGLQRLRQAKLLHANGDSYALAMYCGGLAVECLLRAFRWKDDKTFSGRHNLKELLKASGILRVDEDRMHRRGKDYEDSRKAAVEFRAAINELVVLWHNNLRYASEARLKAHLATIDRTRGIKGDPLKKNSMDLLNAAQLVIDRGIVLWDSQRK